MMFAIRMMDGSVAIMTTVDDAKPEDCIAKWADSGAANVVSIHPIDAGDIPQDRTFRDAWVYNGKFSHDMPRAREIHRDKMRRVRAPLLAALDIEAIRASEAGDTTKAQDVARRKQALRDVTADPRIDAARTPEELKAVWPDVMK